MDPFEDDHELCEQEAAALRAKLFTIREKALGADPSYLRGFILGFIRPQEVDRAP